MVVRLVLIAFACLGAALSASAAPYVWHPRAVVLSSNAVKLDWEDAGGYPADYFQVYRDGIAYATTTAPTFTDTGLAAGENHSYYITSHSSQTYSIPSRTVTVTTKTPDFGFVLDGKLDASAYTWLYDGGCDCGNVPGLPLYAAVRGHTLYVATNAPGYGNQPNTDRFIFISDTLDPSLTTRAPWAKSGYIGVPAGKPFLAAESTGSYAGWFNAPTSARLVRSSQLVEGTIDLVETFGHVPDKLYFAVVAYNTDDGGSVVWQAPNPDGRLDDVIAPDEFLTLNTAGLRDDDADAILDLTDPTKGLHLSLVVNPNRSVTLSFPTVPFRSYILHQLSRPDGANPNTLRAYFPQNGDFTATYTDMYPSYYASVTSMFYSVTVQEPQ